MELWIAPDDDAPLAEKLQFQKKLREHCEDPWNGPANLPIIQGYEAMDHTDYRWWHQPYDPPPGSPKKRYNKQLG
jgi:hypothetical protein